MQKIPNLQKATNQRNQRIHVNSTRSPSNAVYHYLLIDLLIAYFRLANSTRRRAATARAASAANANDTAPKTRSVSAVPAVGVEPPSD